MTVQKTSWTVTAIFPENTDGRNMSFQPEVKPKVLLHSWYLSNTCWLVWPPRSFLSRSWCCSQANGVLWGSKASSAPTYEVGKWAELQNVNSFTQQNCIFSQTFYPQHSNILHRYIWHICDILQLCKWAAAWMDIGLGQNARIQDAALLCFANLSTISWHVCSAWE